MSKPQLLSALLRENIQQGIPNKAILGYFNGTTEEFEAGTIFVASGLKFEDIKVLVDNNNGIISHINDSDLHWNRSQRRLFDSINNNLTIHINNMDLHVSEEDRENWNSKETEAGSQEKANTVQTNLEVHAADLGIHTTKIERDRWNNTYTREEVANMVANAQSNSVWKQAVNTFTELATTYPIPEKGWICTVLDTMVTYSYDGEKWVTAFINTMPLATYEINGLLSNTLYSKLMGIEESANYYIHPDNMNCRHVTDLQIKKWDNKASTDLATIFVSGLMSNVDKDKLDTVERYANYYIHPEFHSADMIEETDERRFVTTALIEKWNNPVGVMASETQDGAMSKEMYIKLLEIEEKANYYVHPAKHSSTDIAEDTEHRFVTDAQISLWTNKEESTTAQARADQALQLAKEYADKIKIDILGGASSELDTLKELQDALGADKNFSTTILTELSNRVDIITYGNHVNNFNTHLNDDDRLKLDSVEFNANYYIHPDNHPASMIITSPSYRFVTDADIAAWNNKAPGIVATPTQDGIMSKEYAAKLEAISETGKVRSDWLVTDENADSFILNKPESLPANGGNADTIEGFTAEQLKSSNKAATVVVGSLAAGFTDKDVDFLCDGTNDVQQINNAIASLPSTGGVVLFKEGTYVIDTPLTFNCVDTKIMGSRATLFKSSITEIANMIELSGHNCIIIDIEFDGGALPASSATLAISGNNNEIRGCRFTGGDISIRLLTGSHNRIDSNFVNKAGRGFVLESAGQESYGNIISNNNIIACSKEGILLMSSLDYKLSNTIINGNTIWDCYTGIRLTNEYMSLNTVNTVVTGNNIMRGTGLTSDYLYEQRTVYLEYCVYTLVSNNMVRGKDVFDKTEGNLNMISTNLAV